MQDTTTIGAWGATTIDWCMGGYYDWCMGGYYDWCMGGWHAGYYHTFPFANSQRAVPRRNRGIVHARAILSPSQRVIRKTTCDVTLILATSKSSSFTICGWVRSFITSISVRRFCMLALFKLLRSITLTATSFLVGSCQGRRGS